MTRLDSRRAFLAAATAATAAAAALGGLGCASALAQSPAPAPSAALDELLSKQAITELIYKYPRGLDRLDRDILLSVGHPDARVEFGKSPFPSWAAYVDWLLEAHQPMLGNNHRITNILIEVRGDSAVSESSGTATLLVAIKGSDDFEERWMHSRYLDKWARRNGRWGITHRQTVIDYRRVSIVSGADVRSRYQIEPRRGRDDPSYKLFSQP